MPDRFMSKNEGYDAIAKAREARKNRPINPESISGDGQSGYAPELSSGDGANGNPELMAPISREEAERIDYELSKKNRMRAQGGRQSFSSSNAQGMGRN